MNTSLRVVVAALSLLLFPLEGTTLKERFAKAEAGTYVVSEQGKQYSLLVIHSADASTLLLEEICIPADQVDLPHWSWQRWLEEKAPGHTSWTFYQIDLKTATLVECYSLTKKSWIPVDEDQFLAKLFYLPLSDIPNSKRKKIGPPPSEGETDCRASWIPPLVFEGKKIPKPLIKAYETRWPSDHSKLSSCPIDLYFSDLLPFPVWIECKSPHYTFRMHAVDAGTGLSSPIHFEMPLRPPTFVGPPVTSAAGLSFEVSSPSYFQKLNLFAIDTTAPTTAIPMPHVTKRGEKKEQLFLEVSSDTLKKALQTQHRYRWVLIPEGAPDIYVETAIPLAPILGNP